MTVSQATPSIAEKAILKINMHAAKHIEYPVFGALIGNKAALSVEAAVPILHSQVLPSIILKTALAQLELYCQENKSDIVGFYWSPAVCTEDSSIPSLIQLLLKDVSLLIRLGLSKPNSSNSLPLFDMSYGMIVYRKTSTVSLGGSGSAAVEGNQDQWKMLSPDEWNIKGADDKNGLKSTIRRYIQDEKFNQVYDFEEHLTQPQTNWIG